MPATFNNTGSLPGNKHLSGIKTKEVDGPGSGQLRFDDTPGEVSSQLASTHAASELNLGYLTHPRTDGHGKGRGEGAELATRAAAVVRALQGLMLTTFAFNAGHQLDRDNLNTLLAEGLELFKALGDYAGQHGGTAADTAAQDQLASILKKWDPSGANAGAANDAQAILAFGAAAGSVNLTPKTHVTYAGQNIDQVAQQHLQLTSGQRFNAFAGQGMQWFARGQGIQAIANEGPLVLQAQADTVAVTAQKGIKIATNENEVLITGKTVCFVAEDGSYIRIGDGRITLGTNGPVELLGASHDWGGPSTLQAKRTEFAKAPRTSVSARITRAIRKPHRLRRQPAARHPLARWRPDRRQERHRRPHGHPQGQRHAHRPHRHAQAETVNGGLMPNDYKDYHVIASASGILHSNRAGDRHVEIPRDLPGIVIFIHGVNDPGAVYETVETGLNQGINERLSRSDLNKGVYGGRYKAVQAKRKTKLKQKDAEVLYDPTCICISAAKHRASPAAASSRSIGATARPATRSRRSTMPASSRARWPTRTAT